MRAKSFRLVSLRLFSRSFRLSFLCLSSLCARLLISTHIGPGTESAAPKINLAGKKASKFFYITILRQIRSAQSGLALVECALVLPLLLLLCGGLLSFASFFRGDLVLERALRKSSFELARHEVAPVFGDQEQVHSLVCAELLTLIRAALAREGLQPDNYRIRLKRSDLSADPDHPLQQVSFEQLAPPRLLGFDLSTHINRSAILPYSDYLPIDCDQG